MLNLEFVTNTNTNISLYSIHVKLKSLVNDYDYVFRPIKQVVKTSEDFEKADKFIFLWNHQILLKLENLSILHF